MKKSISKPTFIRLISFFITAILLLIGFSLTGYALVKNYRNSIEYNYQRSLNELCDYVEDIKNTLIKGMYVNTVTGQTQVYSKLMVYSEEAKSSLSNLPVSINEEEMLQKYFSQVGDFSNYLQRLTSSGKDITNKDFDMFNQLQKYSDVVCEKVKEILLKYGNGEIKIGKELDLNNNLTIYKKSEEPEVLDDGFRDMNDSFVEYPTMIYDGPFSDHIMNSSPALTEDCDEITLNQAFEIASSFMNVTIDKISHSYDIDGNLPCYVFDVNGNYLSITKKGGFINVLTKNREINDDKLTYDEALEKAVTFLKENKVKNMEITYGRIENKMATFNFAYNEDSITHYEDLIKVSVALDDGEILGYSATGYIMNHQKREIPNKIISLGEALEKIKPTLKIEKEKMAFIPSVGNNDVYCYEFLCSDEKNKLLIYINAETGYEENIYILLEDESGTLTI